MTSPLLQMENLKKFNGINFVTYQIGTGLDPSLLKEWASGPADGKLFYSATYVDPNSWELIKKLGKEFFSSKFRSSHQRCSIDVPLVCSFIKKETLPQVLSCAFWEIFKNTFLTEHLRTTVSVSLQQNLHFQKAINLEWQWDFTLTLNQKYIW